MIVADRSDSNFCVRIYPFSQTTATKRVKTSNYHR